jgi:uncharacterized cupredoxin-like copper-binding protein
MKKHLDAARLAFFLASGSAAAHGDEHARPRTFDPSAVEQKAFGRAADPRTSTRTMTISMSDSMRFTPEVLSVRRGETVRFVVRNDGKLLHELVLGTEDELARHAELMRKFPDMEHDEPHMVHVKPGRAGEFAWTFNRPGEFRFACLVAGHYEAGMVGRVVVR